VLRLLPKSAHPDLLVGFETSDDAGVFRLSDELALVQTVDFFTPVVDDPYSYGAIAAANSLSDVYAMGGRPITAMNVFCFDPSAAPAEVWAAVLQGGFDKAQEAGVALVGGHSVEDKEPKFGMSVTGVIDPNKMFANTNAKVGDAIVLTKPLGTGIVTTAAKWDDCSTEELDAAIASMSKLNKEASERGLQCGVRCATDVTGFGLAGHLFNVAKASEVDIEIHARALPLFPGVERMIRAGHTTGGGAKNRIHLGERFEVAPSVTEELVAISFDPQTSGGLALFGEDPPPEYPLIGRVVSSSEGRIRLC
jgi:selenide,water dikinase